LFIKSVIDRIRYKPTLLTRTHLADEEIVVEGAPWLAIVDNWVGVHNWVVDDDEGVVCDGVVLF
jgi:hypothetical protein